MPVIKWEPLNELDRFFDERAYPPLFPKLGLDLAADIYEEKGAVVAKMNIPGIDPDELDVSVDEDILTVSGSREEEKETDEKDYYSKEIRRGLFSRSVRLPKSVDAKRASAGYKDGVIVVTLPIVEGEERSGVKVPVRQSRS